MIKRITEEAIAMLMQNGIKDKKQIETLRDVLLITLSKYEIKEKETSLVVYDSTDANIIQRFFVAKTTCGLSARSLTYYKQILKKSLETIGKHLKDITADDIRAYLTMTRLKGSSNVTLNNERRVLSSFFTWCHDEEFLPRNIMKRVDKIKVEKKVKKPFTEEEMERLRTFAKTDRDKAIIEFLYSTGCRVSEMVALNRDDIDYESREVTVLGKGNKQRKVFLSYRCIAALQSYQSKRLDKDPALFVSMPSNRFPHRDSQRLLASGVEVMIRTTGKRAGIDKAHPHRIRRTAATFALRRGMPIEQVSKMLGHEDLKTTTIYANSTLDEVKASHDKFI